MIIGNLAGAAAGWSAAGVKAAIEQRGLFAGRPQRQRMAASPTMRRGSAPSAWCKPSLRPSGIRNIIASGRMFVIGRRGAHQAGMARDAPGRS